MFDALKKNQAAAADEDDVWWVLVSDWVTWFEWDQNALHHCSVFSVFNSLYVAPAVDHLSTFMYDDSHTGSD